jgi:hypothetical protein
MIPTRGRVTLGALALALVVGGIAGWSLRGSGGTDGHVPAGNATPPHSGAGGVVAWIEGTVREGGEDFVLLNIDGGEPQPRIIRIEHVRWKTAPGARLVVPPPKGTRVCARVVLAVDRVRSGTFEEGSVFEGARCSLGRAG